MPGTSLSSRMSRTFDVYWGFGPSSKVSTMVFFGTDSSWTFPLRDVQIGPDSRAESDTWSYAAPSRTRLSLNTSPRT